jgi:arylsulfatase B
MEGMDFRRNLSAAWDLSGRYATDIFTKEVERIIQDHNSSVPLFLYLAHLAGHAGNSGKLLEAPQQFVDKFPHIMEPNRRTYAGACAHGIDCQEKDILLYSKTCL